VSSSFRPLFEIAAEHLTLYKKEYRYALNASGLLFINRESLNAVETPFIKKTWS